MSERIQCPHCETHLAGKGHLKRHIMTVHKLESSTLPKDLTGIKSTKTMEFDGKSTFSIAK